MVNRALEERLAAARHWRAPRRWSQTYNAMRQNRLVIDYFCRGGKPMTRDEWARYFEDRDYQQVASDEIEGTRISTIWLGLNHSIAGPPVIFETMVFGGEHDNYQERYSTEEQALEGHARAVEMVRKTQRGRWWRRWRRKQYT